jgi:phage tail-like protein
MAEYLAAARFEFTSTDLGDGLFVQKVSGLKMSIQVTSTDSPLGVTAGSKVTSQQAASGVKNENITITFVTNSSKPKAVSDWFYNSHPDRDLGGATQTKGVLKTADIKVFKQDGSESANWHFDGVMPLSYDMSALDVGGNQSLTETVTFSYTYVQRKK